MEKTRSWGTQTNAHKISPLCLFWLFLQACATVALVDSKSMALYNTQPSWQPNSFNNNKVLNWLKKLMIPLESTGILQILGKMQKIC